jgi:hypothetical protein
MPDPEPLPDSAEMLRAKIQDLERDGAATRSELAGLRKRLDDLMAEMIETLEEEDAEDELELELERDDFNPGDY